MKKYIIACLILLITVPLFGSEEIDLNILYTNDIHGGIDAVPATFINPDFPPPLGGGASIATYIDGVRKQSKAKGDSVLLLDAGDFFQGHPVGTMTNGTAVIKWMNAVGYDAMALGNHDFDAGYDQLKKTLSLAEFPILTANVVHKIESVDTIKTTKSIIDTTYKVKEILDTIKTDSISKEHIVKSGDCLTKIAVNKLKNYSAWKKIFDINREKIENPDLIFPSQKLELPDGNSEYKVKSYLDTNLVIDKKKIEIVKYDTTSSYEVIPEAKPYIFKNVSGIKIAIIGLTTEDTPLMSFPKHIKGLKFLPVAPTLRKYKKIVKDQGADLIIVLGHLGLPYDIKSAYQRDIVEGHINDPDRQWPDNAMHLVHKVKDIDLCFGGHIHVGYEKPWEEPDNHTLVFQNYAYGSNVGHVTINIDKETKTVAGYELPGKQYGDLVSMFAEEYIPDPEIKAMVDSLQKKAESGMDTVIGKAGIHLTTYGDAQSLIGNTVMDAMLKHSGADFAFLNLGGVRSDITAGPVTYRDVFDVLPFESRIVNMKISGKILKKILEVRVSHSHHGLRIAGGKVVNNRNYPNFERITSIEIGGEKWHPDSIYTVATTDYLMQGNAGLTLLTKIPENKTSYKMTLARDALADYFRNHKIITNKIDDRWQRDDSSQHSPLIKKYNKQKKKKQK